MEEYYSWQLDSLVIFLRYFLIAGAAWFIFYYWKKARFSKIKIQPDLPPRSMIIKEVLNSSITLILFSVTSYLVFYSYESGYTTLYLGLNDHGYLYLFVSVLIMVATHDTYFYWTHRFMHIPVIFKLIHHVHHQSNNPTPWAAFSFHPLEGVIAIGIIPIIVFLIPCHPIALLVFLTYMTAVNVMGHLGYETFPLKFRKNMIGKWHNTSTCHNLHHQAYHYNFGFYFTFWDRVMKTHKD